MKNVAAILLSGILMMAGSAHAAMEHDHGSHQMEHKSEMKMPEGMHMHNMDIDSHKVTFHIMDRKAFRNYMDNMGHKTHKMKVGMTHYIMIDIVGEDGKKIKRAKVKVKVIDPDRKPHEKVGFPMMGSFGAEFDMTAKGKYQVMTLFKVKNHKHHGGFWHEIK